MLELQQEIDLVESDWGLDFDSSIDELVHLIERYEESLVAKEAEDV